MNSNIFKYNTLLVSNISGSSLWDILSLSNHFVRCNDSMRSSCHTLRGLVPNPVIHYTRRPWKSDFGMNLKSDETHQFWVCASSDVLMCSGRILSRGSNLRLGPDGVPLMDAGWTVKLRHHTDLHLRHRFPRQHGFIHNAASSKQQHVTGDQVLLRRTSCRDTSGKRSMTRTHISTARTFSSGKNGAGSSGKCRLPGSVSAPGSDFNGSMVHTLSVILTLMIFFFYAE